MTARRLHISLVLEMPDHGRNTPTDDAVIEDLGSLIALCEIHGATALRGARVLALGIHRKTPTTKETQ